MILYLVIAVAVFVYYMNNRNIILGKRVGLALLWPLTFIMYLFNMVTGRPIRNLFTGLDGRQGGHGRGRGRRR